MSELDAFFAAVRREPDAALAWLGREPELARVEWRGEGAKIPGSTALHWAAHCEQLELMEALLDAGADIDAANAEWWVNPITWAADAGRQHAVELLARRGADLGGDRWSNATPLHAAAQGGSTNGRRDPVAYRATAEVLLGHGADPMQAATYGGEPPPRTALDDALRVGNVAVAELLRVRSASPDAAPSDELFRQAWAIHRAAILAEGAPATTEGEVLRTDGSYDPDLPQRVAHYLLRGDARDHSGLGNHGVVSGASYVADRTGRSPGALDFRAPSHHVRIPDHASLKLDRGLSLCAWVKPRRLDAARIVNKWEGERAAAYNLGCDNGKEIWFEIGDEHGRGREVIAEVSPSFLDRWHLLVGTFDGRSMRLFIDGELAGQRSVRCRLNRADLPLHLGTGDGRSMPFEGVIGEVGIYNYALSPEELVKASK